MLTTIQVKTRKDGSIGLPKAFRLKVGLKEHSKVSMSWDSEKGVITVKPAQLQCAACGGSFKSVDEHMGVCDECLEKITTYVKNGDSLHKAFLKVKEPAGVIRRRK